MLSALEKRLNYILTALEKWHNYMLFQQNFVYAMKDLKKNKLIHILFQHFQMLSDHTYTTNLLYQKDMKYCLNIKVKLIKSCS